jgi:uncharacterized heparinase superfamily protein
MPLLTALPIRRFWHTACHLQPRQLLYQVRRRVLPPRLKEHIDIRRPGRRITLIAGINRPHTYLGNGRFLFLHREEGLGAEIDWQAAGLPRLWQYNLHYFDYLNQPGLDYETGLSLISSWINHHPPKSTAVGWEPYPSSLRLINWIKFLTIWHKTIPPYVTESLLLQTVNLQKQIEYHIGGNHLWANGKALWYAGIFLGEDSLADLGKKIVLAEMQEQFLPEGGHFELSPMYHALLTEDLLDLVNLCQNLTTSDDKKALMMLREAAGRALGWLGAIVDDRGQIPLLNDAAYGIATPYKELVSYAQLLGVAADLQKIPIINLAPWSGRNLSGYLLLSHGPFRLLWDTAPLGPDHLLGHAHCDMLSVLLDFRGQSILTDTGVSRYEEGEQRRYERGTAAHNTVVLDGLEQADMWKAFRVGRRGYPKHFLREGQRLRCSHTGFEIWRPGLQHERMLTLLENGFELTDFVTGPGHHRYQAFFHFAPEVHIEALQGGDYLINQQLLLQCWGAEAKLATSQYSPEFGRVLTRPCLILQGEFPHQHSFGLQFLAKEECN